MKTASGWRRMSATPPRFASSFSSSAIIAMPLLRGQQVELGLLPQRAQLVQALDPVGDRAPVREQSAQPAVVDVRHADAGGLGRDGVLRLLLRADEQHGAAALGDPARERVRLVEQLLRLLQVDDVDAATLGEDEALHLRVPAASLVAEVDSGLQQILHGHNGHGSPLLGLITGGRRRLRGDRRKPGHRPRRHSAGSMGQKALAILADLSCGHAPARPSFR